MVRNYLKYGSIYLDECVSSSRIPFTWTWRLFWMLRVIMIHFPPPYPGHMRHAPSEFPIYLFIFVSLQWRSCWELNLQGTHKLSLSSILPLACWVIEDSLSSHQTQMAMTPRIIGTGPTNSHLRIFLWLHWNSKKHKNSTGCCVQRIYRNSNPSFMILDCWIFIFYFITLVLKRTDVRYIKKHKHDPRHWDSKGSSAQKRPSRRPSNINKAFILYFIYLINWSYNTTQ